MEKPKLPRRTMPLRRGLFALALSGGAVFGAVEFINLTNGHASAEAEASPVPAALQKPASGPEINDIYDIKQAQAEARKAAHIQALAALAATEATTTTSTTAVKAAPPTTLFIASHSASSDATNAFTPNWYRCVIKPESGGVANEPGTGGEFGFKYSTWQSSPYREIWQSQEPKGVDWSLPWEAPLPVQEDAALLLFKENGGFGSEAWNNAAHCGKSG